MNYNLILSLLTITTNITLIFSVKMSRSIASQIKHAFIVAAGIVSILVVILANNFKLVMLAISIALVFTYMYHVELNQSIDGLTSLLNQQCFIHDLQNLHQKAVIIVLDVNDFKQINDTYGHQKAMKFYICYLPFLKIITKNMVEYIVWAEMNFLLS